MELESCPNDLEKFEYTWPPEWRNCRMKLHPLTDKQELYKDTYEVDVFMGRYKQLQLCIRTIGNKLVVCEYIEHTEGRYPLNKTVYKLPARFAAVQLDHSVYTYGLFVVKAPQLCTPGELEEFENCDTQQRRHMIRNCDGDVIDDVANHLFKSYLSLGRFKANRMTIKWHKDRFLFSTWEHQPCGCLEDKLLGGYYFSHQVEEARGDKISVWLTPERNFIITVVNPEEGQPPYVVEHKIRLLPERDGLANINANWAHYKGEEVYKMTLLCAFTYDNAMFRDRED